MCYKHGGFGENMKKENSTKEEILQNAIRLFKEKGYDEVTLRDICKASNISKNTFYYYYDSKDALIKGLFFSLVFLEEENIVALMQIEDPYEQLIYSYKTIIQHYVYIGKEIIKKALVFNFTQISSENIKDKPKKPEHDFIREVLVGIYKRAQEKEEIRTDVDVRELIRISLTLLVGTIQIWSTAPFDFDLEKHYVEAYEILVCGEKRNSTVTIS